VNSNILLSTAAVGLLIAGGAAYTMRSEPPRSDQRTQVSEAKPVSETKPPPRSRVERVMDPAGVSTSASADQARIAQDQAQKSVRVVYPNVQSSDTQSQPAESQQNAQPSLTPPPPLPATPAAASDNARPASPPTTPPQPGQTTQPAVQSSKGIVALNAQQQTQVGQAIAQRNVTPLTNVNFSIAIGTQVPRSVQLRALPSDLVTFVPDYRGYSYFVVEEQIMIVEPASHEIVAIVPYAGAAPAPSSVAKVAPMNSRPVSLNTEQREVPKKNGKERRANKPTHERSKTVEEPTRERSKTVDQQAPREVTVESEPRREASPRRRDRFIREDDDVMVIDPDDEDRVVEPRRPFFSGWR
jgi:hypothetical protein